MATKIINVLKDDNFENVLRIFQETPANEVIFVLPKKHEALSNDDHFYILSEAATEQGKNVMVLALKYNLGVLTSAKINSQSSSQKNKKDNRAKKTVVDEPKEVEPEEASEPDDEGEVSEDDSPSDMMQGRGMTDIIKPPLEKDKKTNVKISKKAERPFEIEVRNEEVNKEESSDSERDNDTIRGAIDEIESVWQKQSNADRLSVNKLGPTFLVKRPKVISFSFLNLSKKTLTLLGISVVVLFVVVLFVTTGSAKIIIKPVAHSLDLSLTINTSDKFSSVNLENRTIPGQLFSIEKRVEQTFPATGERDIIQKARGKIAIYNEYGTAPQVLIATTRFESSGGLIFRTLKTVTVPGTKVINGEIIPGSIEVEIIVDKAGEFYNIDAGRFTIPAFKEKGDNDRYQKYYGMSKEPMKGGIVGKAKVVTDQDYLKAKETVHNMVVSDAENALKSQAAELKILSSTSPLVKEVKSTAQVDEAVNDFTISETVELESVAFREADLYDLATRYVETVNNLDVFSEKINLEFKDVEFNKESKILQFKVLAKGSAYSRVNKDKVIGDLMGKNENDIKEYFKGAEGISVARVILTHEV